MEQQEYFMRMQMLGQEAEKFEQQMQAIDQQMNELNAVKESLEALHKDSSKEILANLGKGIFVRAEIKEKDLFVNIGKEVIVKKTREETIKVIEEQTEKLIAGKTEIIERIRELQENMQALMEQAQADNLKSGKKKCEHEHCECEEPCEDCECEKE